MAEKRGNAFPFHYRQEADAYTFYRVPKILFQDRAFAGLSTDAKLLYGLFLDRMQLSMRNGWVDEEGKVFIYFTVEHIMQALSCGNKKAGNLLAELDDRHGVGLITRIKQGLGKPDKLFIHKCISTEMSYGHVQRCQNDMSGDVISTPLEMSKGHTNKTDMNKTEISDTDSIHLSGNRLEADGMDVYENYRNYFFQELGFSYLMKEYPLEKDLLEELLELLVETACSSKPTIRICGEDKSIGVVKSRLMKLDSEHVRYVLSCMKSNTTKVRNIKQYLLAALYNAPVTINSYYTALVNHDLYGTDR